MTNYIWEGSLSNLASTAANWSPSGVPAQGDVVIFDTTGTQNCNWDIALPPSNRSVDEVIIESTFGHSLILDTVIRTKALFLNGTLAEGTADKIVFVNGASPNFFGSYKSFGERFVMVGDSAAYTGTIDFDMEATAGQKVKFDDGQHSSGTVALKTAAFAPDYETPTGTLGYTYFPTLTIESGVTWEPAGDIEDTDRLKQFRIDAFNVSIATFDGGMASYEFLATSGGFQIPVNDGSAYNSGDFTAKFRKMKFRATTAGHKILMPDNRYLSLEELEIGDGVMLLGPTAIDDQGSDIRITKPPKIRGAWSFSQISPGLYRSPQHARGPMSEVKGEFTVDGKLTVTGLIDPTGMVFTPQAVNPELTNPQDTIYINNEDGHLYRGERNVESTVHFNVRNDEGATIPVGAPLYSKGEIGGSNRIKVGIADASDPNKMPAIGLAMEEMNTTSTQDGNMILTGILNENITITGVVEQDIIYVAPHGGSAPYLTITRPTSSSHLVQNIGVCVRQASANVSQGMKVAAIGRTNDSPNCSFLMVNTESTHPQARRLVAGTNITLTDGGAGGDLTIAASGGGGGSGTVTSVAATVPTGFTISGSPITTSGTLALAYDTGYSLPTTAKQGQWDTAYGWGDHAGLYEAAGAVATHEATFNHAAFLTAETDPVVGAVSGIVKADGAGNISAATPGADYVATETDPVFSGSAAASITNAGTGDIQALEQPLYFNAAVNADTTTAYPAKTWNKVTDWTVNNNRTLTLSSNTFTAPSTGLYEMSVSLGFITGSSSPYAATGGHDYQMALAIYVNGSEYRRFRKTDRDGYSGRSVQLHGLFNLNSSDTVEIYFFLRNDDNTGATGNVDLRRTSAEFCWWTVRRVGDA